MGPLSLVDISFSMTLYELTIYAYQPSKVSYFESTTWDNKRLGVFIFRRPSHWPARLPQVISMISIGWTIEPLIDSSPCAGMSTNDVVCAGWWSISLPTQSNMSNPMVLMLMRLYSWWKIFTHEQTAYYLVCSPAHKAHMDALLLMGARKWKGLIMVWSGQNAAHEIILTLDLISLKLLLFVNPFQDSIQWRVKVKWVLT